LTFFTLIIVDYMIRSKFENIFKYIHLISNMSIITSKVDHVCDKIVINWNTHTMMGRCKLRWFKSSKSPNPRSPNFNF
jgi:hypothetical protein